MNGRKLLEQITSELDEYAIELKETTYWQLHKQRFVWMTRKLLEMEAPVDRSLRLLDIGNSFQTILFSKTLPSAQLDTLGFFDHRFSAGENSHHYAYNLNDTDSFESWPLAHEGGYDVIMFMEVIEHLYTSPFFVLGFLKTLLVDAGCIIVQTPNAVSLRKRRKLLFGKNPYEFLRTNRQNPGHFREYSISELRRYAKMTGFEVEGIHANSFIVDGNRYDRTCDRISRFMPSSFRSGITMVLRKANSNCIRNLNTLPIA